MSKLKELIVEENLAFDSKILYVTIFIINKIY